MSKIILIKPKLINAAKKKELKDAGYIVIEIKNIKDVEVLDELGSLDKDILLDSALRSLAYGNDGTCRMAFSDLLRKRLLDRPKELNK